MSNKVAVGLLLCALSAQAQVNWTGTNSSDWLDSGNWSPTNVPTSADAVHIDVLNATLNLGGLGAANTLNLGETQSGVILNINTGGTLNMSDAGLFLQNGANLNLNGGSLNLTFASSSPSLDFGTALNINDGGTFSTTSVGPAFFTNNGAISLTAGVGDALWQVSGGLHLATSFPAGTITLGSTGAGTAHITGMTGNDYLAVDSGQTLQGFGLIDNLGVVASGDSSGGVGLVSANVSGATLTLDSTTSGFATGTNNNGGIFSAANGGTLKVNFGGGGFFNDGTLRVDDAASSMQVLGNVANFISYNDGNHSLNGGTYSTAGTMQLAINGIQTNNANIVLAGASGKILDHLANDAISNSLQTNNGSLTVSGGATLALTAASFTNHGIVNVTDPNSVLDLTGVSDLSSHFKTEPTTSHPVRFELGTWNITGNDQSNPTKVVYNAGLGAIQQIGQLTAIGYPGVDAADKTFLTLNGAGAMLSDGGTTDALRDLNRINSNGTLTLISHDSATTGNLQVDGSLVLQDTHFQVKGSLNNVQGTALVGGSFDLGGTSQLQNSALGNIDTIGDGKTATSLTLRGLDAMITADGSNDGLTNLNRVTANASLTFVDRDFITAGNFQNDGTLTVQSTFCVCPTFEATGDFINNGTVNLIGDITIPGSGTLLQIDGNFTNVHTDGTLVGGNYNLTGNSAIFYNGAAITQIGDGVTPTSLSLTTGDAGVSNDLGSSDALEGLQGINKKGSLTLTGYAMFTSGDFFNNGSLTIQGDSIGDVGALVINFGSGSWSNVNGSGVLQGGSTTVGDGGILFYTGATINQIGSGNPGDYATSLTLRGLYSGISNDGGFSDALSLSKIASNGSLTLDGYGTLNSPGDFTNDGSLTLKDSSFFVGPTGSNALTNLDGGGVLTGGSYSLSGLSTFQYSGPGITQLGDDATHTPTSITLNGPNALFTNDGSSDALAPLAKISQNSSLTLIDRPTFTTQGNFTNNGSLTLQNTNFTVVSGSSLTNFNAGTGTLAGGSWTLLQSSALQFDGGPIVNWGDGTAVTVGVIDGAAKFTNDGVTDALSGLQHVAVNGDLTLQNGYSLTTSGPLIVDGALKVTGNSTVNIGDQLTVNGSLGLRDHSKFSSAGLDVGVNGSIHVGEASVLDASGGRFLAIDGAGTLLRGTYVIDGLLVKSGIDQSEFSSIKYNGAADGSHLGIQTIGAGVNLTLNGRGAGNAFQDIGAANTDSLSQLHQIDGTVVAENSFKKTFSNDNSSGFTPFNQVNNGSLTIQGKISFPTYPLETTWSVNGQFTNNGLLTVGAGGNFNDFDLSDANYRPSFTNTGTVQVQSGGKAQFGQWIDLSGGVLGGSGVYDIQDKGEVRYRGASSSDLISEIGRTVNLTLHGNYALVDQFNPGPNDATADALQALAKIDNGASLTLTDNADLSTSQSLENDGSLTLSAGGHLESPNVTNTNYLAISPGSQLTTGVFTQSGNGANTEVDGTLFANVDLIGGLLHGDGLIFGDVTQTGGTMHAGNSPGTLNVAGNYSQGVGSFLEVDFNSSDPFGTPGTDWSFLTVAGNATLDGTVTVNLLHALTFHLGDLFEIMTYGSLSSNPLLNVQFLELGGGMHFAPVFGANELDLQVVADATNTPEPGTLVLLAAGLAGFVTMARRRGGKK